MPPKLKPRKFRIGPECKRTCTLNPANLPGGMPELLHQWYEEGANDPLMSERSDQFGHHLSQGAIANHRRKHIHLESQFIDITQSGSGEQKAFTDLEVLELMISKGASGLDIRSVKITPEMTIRAIELKYKLTQGNVFEGFIEAMGQAMEDMPFDEAAVASEDEREQAADDG